MRHKKLRLQLNRFTSWRKATLKSELRSLLIYQSIKTTKARALAVKPLAEKLITLAKKNSLFAKRQAYKTLGDHKLVSLLFGDIASRFGNRSSGFTRILNLNARRGDNAKLVILELTEIKKREFSHPKKEKVIKPQEEHLELPKEKAAEETKPKAQTRVMEKPPIVKKESPKKFLGGLRNIFKKERDSL